MSIDIQENDNAAEPEVQRVAAGLFSWLVGHARHDVTMAIQDVPEGDDNYAKAKRAYHELVDEIYEEYGDDCLPRKGNDVTDRLTDEQKKRMRDACSKYASEMYDVYTTFFLMEHNEEEYQDEQRRKRLAR